MDRRISEDWLAVILGFAVFTAALATAFGLDLLGFATSPKTWIDSAKAIGQAGSSPFDALAGLVLTFVVVLALVTAGAYALGRDPLRFGLAFSAVYWLAYICWVLGSYATIAATTPAQFEKFGIDWSLKLTGESGYLIALLVGLFIANAMPRFAQILADAARPELFIKTAIVILGGTLGLKAAQQLGLASSVMFRGLAAIIEAYLIYWGVVYFVARKWFGLTREWAAPLASGISICGVSAAIATAGAIRARPVVPVMVASLVVVFAMVELVILPFVAAHFLWHEPMVAAAWMGLAVKTDGAAVASGAITEALILSEAQARGIVYEEGWMLGTTTTVKVFIDIFIGIWAFILAYIWTTQIDKRARGGRAKAIEIWERFPKFVLGFVATFFVVLILGLAAGDAIAPLKAAMSEANVFRKIFFLLTFFAIGLMADLRKLWAEGIGRLAAVYVVCLFGFVIWVGLAISWIFFNGVEPPIVAG